MANEVSAAGTTRDLAPAAQLPLTPRGERTHDARSLEAHASESAREVTNAESSTSSDLLSRAMGPVKVALLRAGRSSKIVAHGAGIGFTLDEPSQQSLGIVITSGGRRYCALFGAPSARTKSDDSSR